MKPWIHICKNCEYFGIDEENGRGFCVNCDSPGDIRDKEPDDVCDGGGCGSDFFGFKPRDISDEHLRYEIAHNWIGKD